MKLLFKQKLFSWFDTYHIYNEDEDIMYTVKGKPAWGHLLRIYNNQGQELGHIKQKVFSMMPQFEMYLGEKNIGYIRREFAVLKPKYNISFNGWKVEGNWVEWDYRVLDQKGELVGTVSKELFKMTDTYSIDVVNEEDALYVLMLVLAIDAEKCSRAD